jgi:anhydro-N-acetylmuramic acid kinase
MKNYTVIGLMSGTSLDGIDLAMIESDGKDYIKKIATDYLPYDKNFKQQVFDLINNPQTLGNIKKVENQSTFLHIELVNKFLAKHQINPSKIDLIGYHGQTIFHDPKNLITWQIGNAHLLANQTKINVIADFRTRDVAKQGQGAPLVPIYHFYLLKSFAKQNNIAVLNIGGVSNLTIFNRHDEDSLIGFDLCFGNAPFDDLIKEKLNQNYDDQGKLTSQGIIDQSLAQEILANAIFHQPIPRSFDRQAFNQILQPIKNLKIEDAFATLAFIFAEALKIAIDKCNVKPEVIFICGGGRKNLGLLNIVKNHLKIIEINDIDDLGLDGDSIEAEAFAFLAIRSVLNLPISFAKTTNIKDQINCSGGVLFGK